MSDAAVQPEEAADVPRIRALLDGVGDLGDAGTWEWAPSEGRLEWSDRLYGIYGYEAGEIEPSPEHVFALTHPDDHDAVVAAVEALRIRGELQTFEYRIVLPDRGVRHLRATLCLAESAAGAPLHMSGWVLDATAERWAERESAAHYAVATALSEWDGLESGAARLLGRIAPGLGLELGTLWVPDGDALVPWVVWPGSAGPGDGMPRARRLSHGPEPALLAWARVEPVAAPCLAIAPPTPRWEPAAREGLRGALAIPAISDGEVLAVIELAGREEVVLTEHLTRALTGIGYIVGCFLSRRRGQLAPAPLTRRELEVLVLAAEGLSARRTAERLLVSPSTVRTHHENIYAKLGVRGKASAVAVALRQGLMQ